MTEELRLNSTFLEECWKRQVMEYSSPLVPSRRWKSSARTPVDLVLTEHIVPSSLGGRTLAAIMRKLKPEVSLAIYSADWGPWPEDMQFADMFITKLVSVEELFAAIRKLLARRPVAVAA